jgi:hypothetical protein
MRCKTLKAWSGGVGGLLDYYAGLVEDRMRPVGRSRGPVDYYLDPDEPAGRWWGHGLDGVGLSGEVTGEDLRSLLDGRHPQHSGVLGRRFGDSSARGFDAAYAESVIVPSGCVVVVIVPGQVTVAAA